jgi:hypothetical protein
MGRRAAGQRRAERAKPTLENQSRAGAKGISRATALGWFGLLLTTGLVLADGAAGVAEAQAKPEATPGQSQPAQGEKAESEAKPEDAQTADGQAPAEGDAKLTSVPGGKALGMSILGNQEAPTSLVIVPWKTSELGGSPGISLMLDDSRQPVDKDVFMRALRYHEIKSGTTGQDGAKAGGR